MAPMATPQEPGPVAPIHPGAPPADPERPEGIGAPAGPEEARWRPWMAPVALISALGLAIVGGLVIGAIGAIFGAGLKDPPPAVDIVSTIWQDACFIGAAVLFAATVARPRPWQFGLRAPPRPGRAAGWAVLGYVAFITFAALWLSALGLENEKDTLPDKLGVKDSDVALIAVAFLVCVVAPLAEEFFFRGFFFRSLANWHGVWPAAVITGLVFGLVHAGGSPVGFLVPLAFFGFVLCVLYAVTRSLYPPIALHCVNNSIAYGSAVGWGWQVPVAMVCALAILGLVLLAVRRVAGPPPGPAVGLLASHDG